MKSLFAIALFVGATFTEANAAKALVGYFPNWLYANYPLTSVPYSKYTHLNYAFAIANDVSGTPKWADDSQVSAQLPTFVTNAHQAGSKVLISVGGWSGCIAFSKIAASASARKAFIDWNVAQIKTYDTDGVDIDWEYPGKQGAGCNGVDVDNDTPNFLTLLKELRASLDSNFPKAYKEISLANRAVPFETSNGPSKDVSAFAPYVDRFQLMLYDINGAWNTTTGPNAPFRMQPGYGAPFSYVDGIQSWINAGIPASKVVAGLAYYGHSMKANQDMTKTGFQYQSGVSGNPLGDGDDAYWQDTSCSLDPGGYSGVWKWSKLRSQGVLTTPTTAASPWVRYFDSVSQTPWLFNPSTNIFISYDDPVSLKVKVDYALCQNLAGVMVWDIHQDNGELLAVVSGIQGSAPSDCSVPDTTTSTVKTTKSAPISPSTTKTTTTKTTTSTTSSATSVPAGCAASNNGQSVCVSPNKSADYNQCLNNSWLTRQCGPGTVCQQLDADNIKCDFPQ
ncbi:glycosyl hydrolases family 18-domain-containing protein [Jimgerdemannia flammicorona]|uniref:Glycosyl hydrolases family 18-domain-containing protein n=1 Tax=Jimgerdemannia flammicorona TaxID=994334 RepID=A0A433QE28_9FUNG|nr:glycosyl hydrolases family 18-domain-containing protein [Jimgerdemannia flammicorona]